VNFSESESYLLSLGNEVSAMKLGLENIRSLLAALGNPEKNYLKVQVAGTNGKGSVCAFLDAICVSAHIKAGVFTSPHLVSISERIRIEGTDISEAEFARHASDIRATAERLLAEGNLAYRPTFFEQVTAIALVAFAEARVEVAILETGLGGRLDATTAANAEIAVITRIDLDHQEYLGGTIEEIAAEKAAIITAETRDVAIGEQPKAAMAILRNRCKMFGIEPLNDEYEPWRVLPLEGEMVKVILSLLVLKPIRLGLKGRHQIENANTAVQTARALLYHGSFSELDVGEGEDEICILEGLQNACHPGRLEYQGQFLFDGAHNVSGARVLAEFLDEFETRPITLVFGAMQGKDVAGMSEILFPRAESIVITQPKNSRAMEVSEILKLAPRETWREKVVMPEPDVKKALSTAANISGERNLILVTGSLYLVGEAKKILNN
jgi:dihydrofolate synthase/folylpolyglutamate synthase